MRTATVTDTASTIAIQTSPALPGWVAIQNPADNEDSVFLGFDGDTAALTNANGFELAPGESVTLSSRDLPGLTGPIRAVCAATKTATVRIQEVNFKAA